MIKIWLSEKVSENDYSDSIKGIAYKVFKFKDGKLYPPMVYNLDKNDTPTGVWLDAEEGEFIELDGVKRVIQKGGNKEKLLQRIADLDNLDPEERKKAVKSIKGSTLAYRPGWHLGDVPRAKQFDREFGWEIVEPTDGTDIEGTVRKYSTFINSYAKKGNVGKIYYVEDIDSYIEVTNDNAPYFPYDFVWAECEYLMDIDYQDQAKEQGYKRYRKTDDGGYEEYRSNKYQHSLAGLKQVPTGGYYRYRTNPKIDTVPWVITGSIKVTKLLDDFEVAKILGGDAPERQGGNKTLNELGLKQI